MLDRYINLLKAGQIVAFPTETVYGLGADAWNVSAVQKVFDAKQRPPDNPLIVHISSRAVLDAFAAEIPEQAKELMTAFWPGPLTLIFKKKPEVLDIVTAGLDTVALRWPSHPLSQDLIARAGPLVAPSANTSGKPSPTRPAHVREDFGEHFPIVEAGETQLGLESTVLDVSETPFRLYRPGGISRKQIEDVIGQQIEAAEHHSGGEKPHKRGGKPAKKPRDVPAKSPGTKYSHYAPEAQVQWLSDTAGDDFNSESALYLLHASQPEEKAENIIYFENDYAEMAHQLYDRFRQADRQGYAQIFVEPFSEALLKNQPLAEALHNRISKAVGEHR